MSVKSITDLLTEANTIKNATVPGENTANRVGGTLVDMIDSQFQILPPTPQIEYDYSTSELRVFFLENGFDFTTGNPEIFLFRYKAKKRKISLIYGNKLLQSGWKHPATVNAATKWSGWKFFNGSQSLYDGSVVNTRITEWAVPSTVKPYQRTVLTGFNKYMFINEIDTSTSSVVQYDSNILSGAASYQINNKINSSNSNLVFKLGGTKTRINTPFPVVFQKINTYCFALAIDNPYATKTNNLCPKIFSQFSEPINAIWEVNAGTAYGKDIVMLKNVDNRLGRVVRNAKF